MLQVLFLSQGSGAAEETIANQTSTGHPGHSTCGTDTAIRLVHINLGLCSLHPRATEQRDKGQQLPELLEVLLGADLTPLQTRH